MLFPSIKTLDAAWEVIENMKALDKKEYIFNLFITFLM
ncbi:hypothetical protein LLB_2663 [Legionella longbeachae D-4968]|nr:hypothetical protein LLB_2663 [Legionella longbeachae D-4968]